MGLATASIAPSCWDTGTDINQGQLYLNGDFYTKHVSSQNDTFVTDYNCTWIETTRKVIGDIESSNEEVTYTYECFEEDKWWGYFTLCFVFVLPGSLQVVRVFRASGSLEARCHKIIGYAISLGLILLMPFFPLQVFFIKLFAFLTNGPEMKKISQLMTLYEATSESIPQLVLQLYIIFTRADRQPSTSQILSLSSSILFIAKSHLEENLIDKPNESLLKKLTLLPQKLFFIVFFCGSFAILSMFLQIIFFHIDIGWIFAFGFGFLAFSACLSCICMKSKISQGQRWYDQKYKGVYLWILIWEVVFFIMLPILLVVINNFPDMTIYSNLKKLSDIAVWANYVISTILVSGVIYRVLDYKQNIKTKETIQILNKDDQHNIYKIPRGALQDSPLEAEVVKVSVDGKTFIVPKDDLDIEKYPQESETKTMVKSSNEKDGCFKNLKCKVSCRVEDETPKPTKAYIVKIEDMKKMTVNPENCIDG